MITTIKRRLNVGMNITLGETGKSKRIDEGTDQSEEGDGLQH